MRHSIYQITIMPRNAETNIQNSIIISIGQRADVLCWRNQTGAFRSMDNPQRVVHVGDKGSPDILSVVAVTITPEMVGKTVGVAVGIEVKTATGKQSEQQQKWQKAFEKRGGIYQVCRTPAEAIALMDTLSQAICNR